MLWEYCVIVSFVKGQFSVFVMFGDRLVRVWLYIINTCIRLIMHMTLSNMSCNCAQCISGEDSKFMMWLRYVCMTNMFLFKKYCHTVIYLVIDLNRH